MRAVQLDGMRKSPTFRHDLLFDPLQTLRSRRWLLCFPMPITREGRFLVFPDKTPVPHLGLESDILELCIEECLTHPYSAVFGTPSLGFRGTDLDCLSHLRHLEAIWFWDVALRNIDAVYTLPHLQSFGVHPKRPPVDFARLPTLKTLVWIYKAQDRGLNALASLERLSVWRYQPKGSSFAGLEMPPHITELDISWANPVTLEGLTPNSHLRRLTISRCRSLESLELLPRLYPSLEHLVVTECGRVSREEGERVVRDLPSLNHAFVGGVLTAESTS
jgi:hypothetical protein